MNTRRRLSILQSQLLILFALVVLFDSQLEPEQQAFCNTIHSSGVMLLSTISDVLDYSEMEIGSLELNLAPFPSRLRWSRRNASPPRFRAAFEF